MFHITCNAIPAHRLHYWFLSWRSRHADSTTERLILVFCTKKKHTKKTNWFDTSKWASQNAPSVRPGGVVLTVKAAPGWEHKAPAPGSYSPALCLGEAAHAVTSEPPLRLCAPGVVMWKTAEPAAECTPSADPRLSGLIDPPSRCNAVA